MHFDSLSHTHAHTHVFAHTYLLHIQTCIHTYAMYILVYTSVQGLVAAPDMPPSPVRDNYAYYEDNYAYSGVG